MRSASRAGRRHPPGEQRYTSTRIRRAGDPLRGRVTPPGAEVPEAVALPISPAPDAVWVQHFRVALKTYLRRIRQGGLGRSGERFAEQVQVHPTEIRFTLESGSAGVSQYLDIIAWAVQTANESAEPPAPGPAAPAEAGRTQRERAADDELARWAAENPPNR